MSEQRSAVGRTPTGLTFGKSCSRCNVYFLTSNRLDDRCPWCTKVELGVYTDSATDGQDDQTLNP